MNRLLAISSIVGLTLLAGMGCGNGHETRESARLKETGAEAEIRKAEDEAANAIIAQARSYLGAREKGPGKVVPKGPIAAEDEALDKILEAAAAFRVAARAEQVAEDAGVDPGRAARVKDTAALVRRAAQVVINQARETIRTGDAAALETDALYLRAVLRAFKVDLLALERETDD